MYLNHILKIPCFFNLKYYFYKNIDSNNKELEGVLNNRYKAVKTIGAGAQGTVYEVEDLTEDRKR